MYIQKKESVSVLDLAIASLSYLFISFRASQEPLLPFLSICQPADLAYSLSFFLLKKGKKIIIFFVKTKKCLPCLYI